MRIAIIGAGAVGGYFGGRLAEAGVDVVLLARGGHLEAIRAGGLTIRSGEGDAHVRVAAVEYGDQAGEVDAVLVATKTWQLEEAARQIPPMLSDSTVVLGLQNGVEAADVLADAVGAERVLWGTCRLVSFIQEPGVISHVGAHPTILFGEKSGPPSGRVGRLEAQLQRAAGMSVETPPNIEAEVWTKFLFLTPASGVGAVTRAPVGVVRDLPETRDLFLGAQREIFEVGRARGVQIDDVSLAWAVDFWDHLPDESVPSMQRDLEAGRPSEVESLVGAVVRLGEETGVATPVNALLYAALLPRERAARAG